ncbi:MAG: hypothetical protein WC859_08720 [Elusimicrobiota bacterium]|jgi:hypothetical protein
MDRLARKEPEVLEGEIVGLPPRPLSWWRRLLARGILAVAFGVLGLGLCALGGVLTLTIIGATIGVPLILVGLILMVIPLILLFGGGSFRVISSGKLHSWFR